MNFNLEFQCACQNGLLDVAKDLVKHQDVDVGADFSRGFRLACGDGHLDIAKWLVSDCGVDPTVYFCDGFVRACRNGHINVVVWLLEFYATNNMIIPNSLFYDVCRAGHYEVIVALLSSPCVVDDYIDIGDLLAEIAESGCIQLLQLAIRRFNITTKSHMKIAFDNACLNGKLELAQWIATHYPFIDISRRALTKFKIICFRGRFDVAKWLYDVSLKTNIKLNLSDSVSGFQHHNLIMYKWLYKRNLLDVDCIKSIFEYCCRNGHIDVCEWILSSDNFVIDDIVDIFRLCCINDNITGAKWLTSKYPEIDFTNNCIKLFIEICQRGHYGIIKYIIDQHPDIIAKVRKIDLNSIDADIGKIYFTNKVKTIQLLEQHGINLKSHFEHMYFDLVCWRGYLSMAKYIVREFGVQDLNLDSAFIQSYNPAVLQWLCELQPDITTGRNIRKCFLDAANYCRPKIIYWIQEHWSKHLKVSTYVKAVQNICDYETNILFIVNWFFEICPTITQPPYINSIFLSACRKNNLTFAKYLTSKYTIGLDKITSQVFQSVCSTMNVELVEWLYLLVPTIGTYITANNCEIISELDFSLDGKNLLRNWLISKCGPEYAFQLLEIAAKKSDIKTVDYIIRYFDIHQIQVNKKYQGLVNDRINYIHNTSATVKSASNKKI